MDQRRQIFYKKTRKGKVVRLVHEHYFRDDCGCGYMWGNKVILGDLKKIVQDSPHKQLLIVDTNIAIHQIDVLEHKCPATSLIVILQTVLREVRHLNMSIFQRISTLLNDEEKSFVFFPNEVAVETDAHRIKNETINDANDRAIRTAAKYFSSLLEPDCSVILITNDKENLRKGHEEGITSLNLRNYVTVYVQQYPELLDLLAADSSNISIKSKAFYPPHLPLEQLMQGLQTKRFLKGTIRSKGGGGGGEGGEDCYVVVHVAEGQDRQSVSISGYQNVNRAMDGDVVVVELLPAIDPTILSPSPTRNDTLAAVSEGGLVIGATTAEASVEALEGLPSASYTPSSLVATPPQGRVVGVLKRTFKQFAGSIDTSNLAEGSSGATAETVGEEIEGVPLGSAVFVPVDRKMPRIRIFTRRLEELIGCRLLVSIDDWPVNSLYPLGHCVRVLGKDSDKAVETAVLLHEFGVSHGSFSTEVMACLPPVNWRITDDIIAQRTDFRSIPVVSIDPPGCKDIDDALHCVRKANGNLEVGVHIADVTYFVHPGTALDKEAAQRSTSTYLVDRRLDMLPGYLTTELCSLRSKEDHLAFSVIWEMDDEANVVNVQFFKSVIHSVASLTYDQAQAMLDAPKPYGNDDIVGNSVRSLAKIARILRQRRIDMGALTLASPEVRFQLDQSDADSNPTDVSMYALKEANALVEEFMLLANITVSEKTLKHFPTLSVLRRHQPPTKEQFAPLLNAAAAVGVTLDISSSKSLADSLDRAQRPGDPYFNKLFRILSTRCMMPAQYFCSGEIPKDQWHHYGLAAPVYTHFTSPIRRYADIIVHRLLAAAIGVISLPAQNSDRAKQRDLCSHMNRRHKAAQYAQRASVNLYTLLFFKGKTCLEEAYILSVSMEKIGVMVPRFGIESSLLWTVHHLNWITNENDFTFDVATQTLSMKLSIQDTETYRYDLQVFQQVNVRIYVVEKATGGRRLVMKLLSKDGVVLACSDLSDLKEDASQEVPVPPDDNNIDLEENKQESLLEKLYAKGREDIATANDSKTMSNFVNSQLDRSLDVKVSMDVDDEDEGSSKDVTAEEYSEGSSKAGGKKRFRGSSSGAKDSKNSRRKPLRRV